MVVPKLWVRSQQWVTSQFLIGLEASKAAILKTREDRMLERDVHQAEWLFC